MRSLNHQVTEISFNSFIQTNRFISVDILKTNKFLRKQNWLLNIFSHSLSTFHRNNMLTILPSFYRYTWLVHCMGLFWLSRCWRQGQRFFLLSVILASGEENLALVCCFMQHGNLWEGKGWSIRGMKWQPAIYGYYSEGLLGFGLGEGILAAHLQIQRVNEYTFLRMNQNHHLWSWETYFCGTDAK